MSTLTNRSTTGKGYSRSRVNLSRKLRCHFLGKMSREEFLIMVDCLVTKSTKSIRTVEHYLYKIIIHFNDNSMAKYSYKPLSIV